MGLKLPFKRTEYVKSTTLTHSSRVSHMVSHMVSHRGLSLVRFCLFYIFISYINDLPFYLNITKTILLANDTTIYITGKRIS